MNQSFTENDDNVQYEDSVSYETDEKVLSDIDHHEHRHSSHSIEQLSSADADILSTDKSTESRSSPIAFSGAIDEPKTQVQGEEDINSSPRKPIEETHPTENISSINESSLFLPQNISKPSSANTSLTDVEGLVCFIYPKATIYSLYFRS